MQDREEEGRGKDRRKSGRESNEDREEDEEKDVSMTACLPRSVSECMASRNKRKGFACQVCRFEQRRDRVRAVAICPTHCLRLCTLSHPFVPLFTDANEEVTDYNWMAPEHSMTCWQKAHSFYIPRGLFKKDYKTIDWDDLKFQNACVGSDLYKEKCLAFGKAPIKRGGRKRKIEEDIVPPVEDMAPPVEDIVPPVEDIMPPEAPEQETEEEGFLSCEDGEENSGVQKGFRFAQL